MDTLYPELKTYIYQYCLEFMTEDEIMAKRTVLYNFYMPSESTLSKMKEKGWISDHPRIHAMITDGAEALKDRIVNRIWDEHRDELCLNLCPVCNKIARTPAARQCRFCFHDWHEAT
ncbi:hypothetical protein [Chitinophaga arvensicola]|uniref:Uncharacterized protein n=1 Tax=Chitinophaga arvensicola TaxID=29529 RepID=A0A1I0S9F3_9BACT|nr:hypothetical protein [Chitinophaga arvensicola]SEW52798.1 hypothetical protein SAMN04488122_5123 [Chitinophaga arvensicola]